MECPLTDILMKNTVYPYSGTLFTNKRNETLIHIAIWMMLVNIMLGEGSQLAKGEILDDVIYMNYT